MMIIIKIFARLHSPALTLACILQPCSKRLFSGDFVVFFGIGCFAFFELLDFWILQPCSKRLSSGLCLWDGSLKLIVLLLLYFVLFFLHLFVLFIYLLFYLFVCYFIYLLFNFSYFKHSNRRSSSFPGEIL